MTTPPLACQPHDHSHCISQALAEAAQRSDQALEPLCKDFPVD
ncbi:hypothetical protein V2S84_06235 [Azotobacter chroococcum]|nr:hypothetical protein [Azotobacter chroococcum]